MPRTPAEEGLKRRIVVFAKEPIAGHVKTRLIPPLTAAQAARCHAAFLEDSLDRLSSAFRVGSKGAQLTLAAEPFSSCPQLRRLASRYRAQLVDQGEGDLGRRMERTLRRYAEAGHHVVLLGADTPDLPIEYVRAAFDWIADGKVALGPSVDGGYYLLGCGAPVPSLFELDAEWGGATVLSETRARLEAVARPYKMLPSWRDIDVWEDLLAAGERLQSLACASAADRADRTRSVIRALIE